VNGHHQIMPDTNQLTILMWDGRTSSRWRPRYAQIADYLKGWVAELAEHRRHSAYPSGNRSSCETLYA
jgi:hypothetical protein